MTSARARDLIFATGAPIFTLKARSDEDGSTHEEAEYRQPTESETEAALSDWVEFAKQTRIISKSGIVPFDPYEFQREIFRAYWRWGKIVFGKPRQMGLTETLLNIFLFQASREPAFSAVTFSTTGDNSSKCAERAALMAATHPGLATRKANTRELALIGGGTLLFRSSSPEGSRGLQSVNTLFFDEYAYIQPASYAKRIFTATGPSQQMLGAAAKWVIVSTPPPPPSSDRDMTSYTEMLTADNGDRDIVRISNQMRAGEIGPVQWWVDGDGVSVDNVVKFLVHWKAHPLYRERPDHLATTKRRYKLSDSSLNREHDLAFDEQLDSGIVDLKWFREYSPLDLPEDPIFTLQSWDTASTVGKNSSHTAGVTILMDAGKIYIVDLVHERLLAPDVETAIRNAANKWRPNLILLEAKSSALDLLPRLARDMDFRFPVSGVEPYRLKGTIGNAKVIRFEQEIPAIRDARKVYIPAALRAPKWLGKFLSEISKVGIPGADMDIADALSQALKYIRETYDEDDRGAGGFGMRLG